MPENLLQQVEEIVAEARKRAEELEQATKRQVAAIRRDHQKAFAHQLESLRQEMEHQTAAEQAKPDAAAARIAGRLRSPRREDLPKAVELVLKHLRGLTELQELSLRNAAVTDAGLEHLKGLTGLQYLTLRGTQVTDAGVEQLNRSLPNVSVTW